MDVNIIKERLRSRRKQLNLKQTDLSDKVHLSVPSLSAIESGSSLPKVDSLLSLCEVLECDIGYLTGEIDTPRHITTDICEATGLSEDAANALINEPFSGFYDTLIKMTFAQVEEPKEYFSVPTCLYADFLELKQIHQLKKIYEDGIDPALQSLFSSAYSRYKIEKASISGLFTHEAEKLVFRQALESMLKAKYKVSADTPKDAEAGKDEFKEFIVSCSCKKPALVQLGISPAFEEDILNSDNYIKTFVEYFADPVFQYFERTRENAALLENKLQNQFMNIIHYMLENVELTHKKGR